MSYGRGWTEGAPTGGVPIDGRRSEQRSRLLTDVMQAFPERGRDPGPLLGAVARALAPTSDSACAVLLFNEDSAHFTAAHAHASDPEVLAAFCAYLPVNEPRRIETHPELTSVVETLAAHFVPSVPATALDRGAAEPLAHAMSSLGMSSLLVVPLLMGGRAIGAIEVVRCGDTAPPLDEQDLALAQRLAEHAALALESSRLLQSSERELAERQRMAARLQLLAETSQELAEATGDYDRLLAVIARRVAEVVGDLCSVHAVSADGQLLEHGAVHHGDPDTARWVTALVRSPQQLNEGVAGKVAVSGRPLFAPTITREDWAKALPNYRRILERLSVGSAMIVPLVCREKVVGVVSLARSGTDNPYTTDDLRLVQSIATHAALAIANARSYRAEQAARMAAVKASESLRQSEVGHRSLFESSPVAVIAFSIDSLEILAVNRAGLRLYGFTHDEMLAMKISDLGIDAVEADVRAILIAGATRELTGVARHRRKDGSLFFVEYNSHYLTFLGHRARLASVTDVTSKHEAERMRSLLSAIVQSANDAIVSKDLSGTITSWNAAAERLFGYSSQEAIGRSIKLVIPDNLLAEDAALLATVSANEPVSSYETVRRRKDGSLVHVSLSLSPILDTTGKVVGASKTARDLTAQFEAAAALRRTEDQLRQAQKMDAVGRLAGGIAHDFNNALSVILGCAGMVLRDLPPNDPAREDVEEIRTAGVRAADLTRQLLTFSRDQLVAPRVLDLNNLLADMDKMLRRIIGEDIDLVTSPAPGLGRLLADPSHLDQVIMNLVVNARDAMPTGGKLTIETANVELDEDYTREHLGARPGPHVMIAVSDTGHGMDGVTQARIFEPFFTTKDRDKGTGLGLSTVFGIAQQAGGSVWVYSELGKGTTFKVYFPRVDADLDAPKQRRSVEVLRGTETVLLVEDHDNVRAIAHSILGRSGYRVIVARAPGEALLLCEQHRGPIHLLLTDVVMPQLSGIELARRVAETRPSTKVLYMSGYADDGIVRHGVLESKMAFLQKPFTPESLTAKVRDVLDGA